MTTKRKDAIHNNTEIKILREKWDRVISNMDECSRQFSELKEQTTSMRNRLPTAEKRVEKLEGENAILQLAIATVDQTRLQITIAPRMSNKQKDPTSETAPIPINRHRTSPLTQCRVIEPAQNPTSQSSHISSCGRRRSPKKSIQWGTDYETKSP